MARIVWLDNPQLFDWIERRPGNWGVIVTGNAPCPSAIGQLDTTEYLGPLPPGPTDWSEDFQCQARQSKKVVDNSDVPTSLIVSSSTSGGWDNQDLARSKQPYVTPTQDLARPIPSINNGFAGWEANPASLYQVPRPQALNLDVLPALLRGYTGFEPSPASPYRIPGLQALNLDVLPALLRGFADFEPSPASPYRISSLQALDLDVLPALLRGVIGWESSPASPYRIPGLQALNLDVLPAILQGFIGWEPSPASPYRVPGLQALDLDVLPSLLRGFTGFELSPASPYHVPGLQALNLDVLPALLRGFTGFESILASPYRIPGLQALNLDVLPALLRGFTGFEPSPASPYRIPGLQALNLDVLPALLRGFTGFEPSPASPYRLPGLQAMNLDVLPALLLGRGWDTILPTGYKIPHPHVGNLDVFPNEIVGRGWETFLPPQYKIPRPQAINLDVFSTSLSGRGWETYLPPLYKIPALRALQLDVFPSDVVGQGWESVLPHPYQVAKVQSSNLGEVPSHFPKMIEWFFFPETPRPYQVPVIKVGYEDLFPQPSNLTHIEVEPALPPQYKIPPLQALNLDVLPNVQLQVIYPYSPDLPDVVLRYLHPLWLPSDDFWPPVVVPPTPSRLGVGGGEYVCETEEDINRRECLEKTIQAIDGELAELERDSRHAGLKIVEPDVMPPDWRAGDDDSGYWYDPRDPRTYGRPVRPRQEDRTGRGYARQVHYNFASDMDFGVRRRIIGILDRAEQRGAKIFGSEAFVTRREAKVGGNLIVPGTNAWVLQLGPEERLAVAREAVAEGFRLVSFDDTSLSFIHRPTYPWKTLFLGATLGATIMGAGVGVGYLAWGRDLKKLQDTLSNKKSRKKK